MRQFFLSRITAWPSTTLGAVAGVAWLTLWSQMPTECQQWLLGWKGWAPGLVFPLWGALVAGPTKATKDGLINP